MPSETHLTFAVPFVCVKSDAGNTLPDVRGPQSARLGPP